MSLHNPPAGCGCVWAAYAGLARILCFRLAFFPLLFRGLGLGEGCRYFLQKYTFLFSLPDVSLPLPDK